MKPASSSKQTKPPQAARALLPPPRLPPSTRRRPARRVRRPGGRGPVARTRAGASDVSHPRRCMSRGTFGRSRSPPSTRSTPDPPSSRGPPARRPGTRQASPGSAGTAGTVTCSDHARPGHPHRPRAGAAATDTPTSHSPAGAERPPLPRRLPRTTRPPGPGPTHDADSTHHHPRISHTGIPPTRLTHRRAGPRAAPRHRDRRRGSRRASSRG